MTLNRLKCGYYYPYINKPVCVSGGRHEIDCVQLTIMSVLEKRFE